ncbi:MAG: hypothetical protein FJ098_03675 [Deltaproteobacteria bacterium]|nr:hypothetical protein [Deltaproteobacteria bacterium]
MGTTGLKRRKAPGGTAPAYPSAEDVGQDRRGFLRLAGKALLGVSVLGLARCDGAQEPFIGSGEDAALPPGDAEHDWNISGGVEMPQDVVQDLPEEDWALGGAPRPPDTVDTLADLPENDFQIGGVVAADIHGVDTCTVKDAEGEFPPLLGDMPAPDVVTHADTVEEDADAFPPVDGDMPAPRKPRFWRRRK